MTSKNHKDIIRRVAISLVFVGLVDIIYMLFWLTRSGMYTRGPGFFALIGGIFLLRKEDFRVIEKVSVFSGFFFGSVLGLAIAIPFSHPINYWRDKILDEPFWIVAGFIQTSFLLGFSFWVYCQLTSAPIRRQRQSLGLRRDQSIFGLSAGIILGVVSFIHAVFFPS